MKETQEILIAMGFANDSNDVWKSEWFGVFILTKTATPEDLSKFIYNRGRDNSTYESSGLHLQRVVPMLLEIAKTIDNAVENTDPDNEVECGKISDAVELITGIANDNSMFLRN